MHKYKYILRIYIYIYVCVLNIYILHIFIPYIKINYWFLSYISMMSKKLAKLSRSSLDQLRDDIDTLDDFRKGLDQRLGTKGRWGIGLS